MAKLSIIIPARNEFFLGKTVEDILSKATGDIEVIPVLEGYYPDPPLISDKRVKIIHNKEPIGMRAAINKGAKNSTGEYIMKCDAHCLFDIGFDEKLQKDMEDNWVVIPRRKRLDGDTWGIQNVGKLDIDYHYLCYPDPNKNHDAGMHGVNWEQRTKERLNGPEIDDTMSFQGSSWFMKKTWFTDFLNGLEETGIYAQGNGWAQEPSEIGNKTWLGGGQVKVNKKTWYAHLHKGKRFGKGFKFDESGAVRVHNYVAKYWMNNEWSARIHDIDWLVEKFWPVPTWPDNWKELYYG